MYCVSWRYDNFTIKLHLNMLDHCEIYPEYRKMM